jgi:hypothetical protein
MIEKEKNNFFFQIPLLVHHVIVYLLELAVSMVEFLGDERFCGNLIISVVCFVEDTLSTALDAANKLGFV